MLACIAALASCGGGSDGDDAVAPPPDIQTADARDPSVARQWNEALISAIRKDLARPTVHARNLFHMSAAMYDAWALYSDTAATYLADKELNGYSCAMTGFSKDGDRHVAREAAISYAAYRLIRHRFATSPGATDMLATTDALMNTLGYDASRDAPQT